MKKHHAAYLVFGRRRLLPLLLLCASILGSLIPVLQGAEYSEYDVKAAFLFNFAKYIEWPQESFSDLESNLRIGILGTNPFKGKLEKTVEGKTINGHPVEVVELSQIPEDEPLHMVFVARSEEDRLNRWLAPLKGKPVVAVSDISNFAARGGMIEFFMEADRVRFEVNLETVAECGVHIDSKLLNLARITSRK